MCIYLLTCENIYSPLNTENVHLLIWVTSYHTVSICSGYDAPRELGVASLNSG